MEVTPTQLFQDQPNFQLEIIGNGWKPVGQGVPDFGNGNNWTRPHLLLKYSDDTIVMVQVFNGTSNPEGMGNFNGNPGANGTVTAIIIPAGTIVTPGTYNPGNVPPGPVPTPTVGSNLSNLKQMLKKLMINYDFAEESNDKAKGTFDFGPVAANVELAYGGSDSWTASFSLTVDIGVGSPIPLSGSVEIDETETIFSVNMPDSVSIGPIELAGTSSTPNKPFTGVPAFKITCEEGKPNKVSIQAGVNFMSTPMLDVEVGVGKPDIDGKKEMQLSFTVVTPPFNGINLELAMTYSRSKGLEIEHWPDFTLANAANVWEEIENQYDKASTQSACKELVKQVVGNAFSNTFIITPSVSVENDLLTIGLAGSYEVEITAIGTVTIVIDLPSVSIEVPKDKTFPDLTTYLASQIVEQVAISLLNDEEMLSKFLVALFGQKLAEEILSALLCKTRGPVKKPSKPGPSGPSGPPAPPAPPGPPGPPSSGSNLPRLTTPTITKFELNDSTEEIEVEWSAVADAIGYQLNVVRVKDSLIAKAHVAASTATSWAFENETFMGFANYQIQIVASGESNVNRDSEPSWSDKQHLGIGPQT